MLSSDNVNLTSTSINIKNTRNLNILGGAYTILNKCTKQSIHNFGCVLVSIAFVKESLRNMIHSYNFKDNFKE